MANINFTMDDVIELKLKVDNLFNYLPNEKNLRQQILANINTMKLLADTINVNFHVDGSQVKHYYLQDIKKLEDKLKSELNIQQLYNLISLSKFILDKMQKDEYINGSYVNLNNI